MNEEKQFFGIRSETARYKVDAARWDVAELSLTIFKEIVEVVVWKPLANYVSLRILKVCAGFSGVRRL